VHRMAWAILFVSFSGLSILSADDESARSAPPPLLPPTATPASSPRNQVDGALSSDRSANSLLLIPGITAPVIPRGSTHLGHTAASPRSFTAPDPPPAMPSGSSLTPRASVAASPSLRIGESAARSLVGGSDESLDTIPLTLTLEPVPEDPTPAPRESRRSPDNSIPPPSSARGSVRATEGPATSVPKPSGTGFLSRWFGSRWGGSSRETESSISVESHSDPAVEAALKRRVESQIKQVAGDRARWFEVRVGKRQVLIQARPAHFWQRWSLRRSLETISLPTGYRARIEIVD
jgi:hypothetical protein